ncbi:MAG: response regulator [Pseudomonadota bacterium]
MAKILIVDDDANFRETVQALLADEGHEAAIAENGMVAIQTFNNVEPDLVLLDMMMPKMGGFDCAQALRETPLGAKIPIVFVSGVYKNAKTMSEGFDRFQCVEYLLKPFDVDVLLAALAKGLGEAAAAAQPLVAAEPLPEAGRLVDTSVASLLLRVVDDKHSGILDLFGESQRARLFFYRGTAVMAQTRNPQLNVGMTLLRQGQMSAFDYKALLEHVESNQVGLHQALKDFKSVQEPAIKEAYKKVIPQIVADCVAMTGNFRWIAGEAFMRLIPTTSCPILPALYLGVLEAPMSLLEAHMEPRKHLRLNKGPKWQAGKKHLSEGLRSDEVLRSVNGRARIGQIYGSAPDSDKKRSRLAQLFMLLASDAVLMSEEIVEVEPSLVQEAPIELGAVPEVEIDESRFQAPTASSVVSTATAEAFVTNDDVDAQVDSAIEFTAEEQEAREKILAKFAEVRHQDFYELLGLPRDKFDVTAAKKAYFQLAREFHTDSYSSMKIGSAQGKLEAIFAKISEAYDVLGNESKRTEYNAKLDLTADGTTMDVGAIFEAESLMDKARIVSDRGDFTSAARYLDEAIAKYQSPMIEVWHVYCNWRARGNPPDDVPANVKRIEEILSGATVERGLEFCGVMCRIVDDIPRAKKYLQKAAREEGKSPNVERELRLVQKREAELAKKPSALGKLFSK